MKIRTEDKFKSVDGKELTIGTDNSSQPLTVKNVLISLLHQLKTNEPIENVMAWSLATRCYENAEVEINDKEQQLLIQCLKENEMQLSMPIKAQLYILLQGE